MKSKLLLTTAIVGMSFAMNANAASNTVMGDLSVNADYDLAPQNIIANSVDVTASNITLNNVNINVQDTNGQILTIGDALPTRHYFTNSTNFRLNADNEVEYGTDIGTPLESWTVVDINGLAAGEEVSGGVSFGALGGRAEVAGASVTLNSANIITTGSSSVIAENLNLLGGSGIKNWITVDNGTFKLSTNGNEITSAGAGISIELGRNATIDLSDTFFDADTAAYDGVLLAVGHGSTVITNLRNTFVGIDMTADAQASGGKPVGAKIVPIFGRNEDVAALAGTTFNLEDAALADWLTVSNDRLGLEVDETTGVVTIGEAKTAAEVIKESGLSGSAVGAANFWDETLALGHGDMPAVKDIYDGLFILSQTDGKAYARSVEALAPITNGLYQSLGGKYFDILRGGAFDTRGRRAMPSGDMLDEATMWIKTVYDNATLDDTAQTTGFDADTYGVAMGMEKQIDNTKYGIAYSYTHTDADSTNRETDIDGNNFALYSQYKPSDFYVNTMFMYGFGSYEENKQVLGNNVNADYDADTFGFEVAVGQEFCLDKWLITPEAGVRYLNVDADSYTDSLGQTVDMDAVDSFSAKLGAKVETTYEIGAMRFTPEVNLGVSYDLFSDEGNAVVSTAAGSYSVQGEALDKFAVDFGVGVMTDVSENIEIGIAYDGQYRSDYEDHAGSLKFKYNF